MGRFLTQKPVAIVAKQLVVAMMLSSAIACFGFPVRVCLCDCGTHVDSRPANTSCCQSSCQSGSSQSSCCSSSCSSSSCHNVSQSSSCCCSCCCVYALVVLPTIEPAQFAGVDAPVAAGLWHEIYGTRPIKLGGQTVLSTAYSLPVRLHVVLSVWLN